MSDQAREQRENEYGRWVPAEPLPEPFGVVWERLKSAKARK